MRRPRPATLVLVALITFFYGREVRLLVAEAPAWLGARGGPSAPLPAAVAGERWSRARRCALVSVVGGALGAPRAAALAEAAARAREAFAFESRPDHVVFVGGGGGGSSFFQRVNATVDWATTVYDAVHALGYDAFVRVDGDARYQPSGRRRAPDPCRRLFDVSAPLLGPGGNVSAARAARVDFWRLPEVRRAAAGARGGDAARHAAALAAVGAAASDLRAAPGAPAAADHLAALVAAHGDAWARDLRALGVAVPARGDGAAVVGAAEAVGVDCGFGVLHDAALVPRRCCCPLATHRDDPKEQKLVRRVYELGLADAPASVDADAIWRDALPSHVAAWWGL